MKYIFFVEDSDIETYSEDSYNDSDESSAAASEGEDDGNDECRGHDNADDTNDTFRTPDSYRRSSQHIVAGVSPSSTVARQSPVTSIPTANAKRSIRPGILRHLQMTSGSGARTSSPVFTQRETTSKISTAMPERHDRSSSITLGHGSVESIQYNDDFDSQPRGGITSTANLRHALGHFDLGSENGRASAANLTPERSLDVVGSSTTSQSSGRSPRSVVQSIESSDQSVTLDMMETSPSPAGSSQRMTTEPGSMSRAVPRPSTHERPVSRSLTTSISFSKSTSVDPIAVEDNIAIKKEKIERGWTHLDCNAHRPCKRFINVPSSSGSSRATVYRDMIDDLQLLSIEQAQFILSRCTCHWATAFNIVWGHWCDGVAAGKNKDIPKPEMLIRCFHDRLQQAARECCLPNPANMDSIIIDD